jgi:hypothetical protein
MKQQRSEVERAVQGIDRAVDRLIRLLASESDPVRDGALLALE